MSTVQEIIDLGYSKSAASRPETMTEPAQLLARVRKDIRDLFLELAEKNPSLIGTSVAMDFDGAGWPRPLDCLRVLDVYADFGTLAAPVITPGAKVRVVPANDRLVWAGEPSVYELGQVFRPVGQSVDPTAGTLTCEYARAPGVPAQVEDSLDPLIPEFFDDYFACGLAVYLAAQDKRDDDQGRFQADKDDVLLQILKWSGSQTYSLVQRFPQTTPPLGSADSGRAQPTKGMGG